MTTVPVPLRPRLTGFAAERAFIARSLRHCVRDVESLLLAILLPVLLMLTITWVFGGAVDPTGGYVDYVVPGIILTCVGYGASTTAVYLATDLTTGIIDRFRTMPLRASALLTGHVVASLVRNLVATIVVVGVALLAGFRPVASAWAWAGAGALLVMYVLAITYLFAAIGLVATSPGAASGYGFILLFLPYLSSAYVPVTTMPSWLQSVAANQPLTPIIDTLRGLLLNEPAESQPGWALAWCAVILLVAVAWGSRLFRHRTKRR